jgi:hypothetical protein
MGPRPYRGATRLRAEPIRAGRSAPIAVVGATWLPDAAGRPGLRPAASCGVLEAIPRAVRDRTGSSNDNDLWSMNPLDLLGLCSECLDLYLKLAWVYY